MEKKKGGIFFWSIIAIILGWTLYRKFDFETLKFEKPALAVVYIITFSIAIFFLVKNLINKTKQ